MNRITLFDLFLHREAHGLGEKWLEDRGSQDQDPRAEDQSAWNRKALGLNIYKTTWLKTIRLNEALGAYRKHLD